MRKDTILMVISVAVVAFATYFALETFVEQPAPELAPVVPDELPVEDHS